MQPTLIGFLVLIAGAFIFFTRRIEAMLAFTMACMLMSGSAALIVSALGSTSIAPALVALGFLFLRIILPSAHERTPMSVAFRANIFFAGFAAYAAIGAYILPRLFARKMDVVPLRPTGIKHIYDVFPLVPTSQNITTPFYIIGTLMFAVCVFVAARQPNGATRIVKTSIVIVWVHAITGLLGLVVPKPIWGVVQRIFRNGSYAQLDQSVSGFARISGILPEPSSYAAFGFIWFAFMVELWLRDVMPKRTGIAAALMLPILIISTSSSAYVGLGGYALLLVLRMVMNPRLVRFGKMLWIIAFGIAGAIGIAGLFVLKPALAHELSDLLAHFTVEKGDSHSGLQRAFWAKQGLTAFKVSNGLGIGAGSFRSSSLITAILGSLGAIGAVFFLLHLNRVFRPLRASTFGNARDPVDAVGVAATWTTIAFMIPASVGSPSPDPGLLFGFFTAVALALRTLPRMQEAPAGLVARQPWRRALPTGAVSA